ncbi:MAG: hypothetical protein ACJ72A_16425 [Nocardioidaceae bacterium]
MWLALAATQTVLGRLDDTVKAKALELIDRWGELPTPEELDVVPAATAMRTRGNPNVGNTSPGR